MSSKIEDPIHHLREEHDRLLEVVDAMEDAIADLQGPRVRAALQALREGLDVIDREVRSHGRVEEATLYPALAHHVPPQTIEVMIEEHRDLEWAFDLLGQALARGEAGRNEARWHATTLVDLMRRHIDKENNVLFMMVAQMLSDPEYEALAIAIHDLLATRQQVI